MMLCARQPKLIPPQPHGTNALTNIPGPNVIATPTKNPARGRKNTNVRIIVRNVDSERIHRKDFYIPRSRRHSVLRTLPEVAVAVSALALILHHIHHWDPVRQHSIAEIFSPRPVAIHAVQHRVKRKQRDHAGIPRQVVFVDGARERIAGEITVRPRSAIRIGNLVGESRRCQNLGEEWIGIQSDRRHHLFQLLRIEIGRGWWRGTLRYQGSGVNAAESNQ